VTSISRLKIRESVPANCRTPIIKGLKNVTNGSPPDNLLFRSRDIPLAFSQPCNAHNLICPLFLFSDVPHGGHSNAVCLRLLKTTALSPGAAPAVSIHDPCQLLWSTKNIFDLVFQIPSDAYSPPHPRRPKRFAVLFFRLVSVFPRPHFIQFVSFLPHTLPHVFHTFFEPITNCGYLWLPEVSCNFKRSFTSACSELQIS